MEVVLTRKIRFRQQRIYKVKIAIVLILFLSILFTGLIVVDFNKSYILYGKPCIELFQIEMIDNDICQLKILNSKFDLNLKYLKKDLNKIKNYIEELKLNS